MDTTATTSHGFAAPKESFGATLRYTLTEMSMAILTSNNPITNMNITITIQRLLLDQLNARSIGDKNIKMTPTTKISRSWERTAIIQE